MLDNYSKKLQEIKDFRAEVGLGVSQSEREQIEKSNDLWERAGRVFTALKQRLAVEMAPVLIKISNLVIRNAKVMREWAEDAGILMGKIVDRFRNASASISFMFASLTKFRGELTVLNTAISKFGIAAQHSFFMISSKDKAAADERIAAIKAQGDAMIKAGEDAMRSALMQSTAGDQIRAITDQLRGTIAPHRTQESTDPSLGNAGKALTERSTAPQREAAKRLEEQYEQLRESLQSRSELLEEQYQKDLAILKNYHAAKKTAEEQVNAEIEALAMRHRAAMSQIEEGKQRAINDAVLGGGKDIVAAIGETNKKALAVSKVLGAAQAWVSTLIGASRALELPFPANLAAAAAVIAKGISLVTAIKAASSGSSGGGGTSSGGGSSTGSSASGGTSADNDNGRSTAAVIQLMGGPMYSRDQVIELINGINEAVEDGAQIRVA